MEAPLIVKTLSGRSSHPPKAAVSCLLNFNQPMSSVDAKAAVEEAESTGAAYPTFTKPAQELPVSFVLQVILSAAGQPFLEWSLLRSLLLEGIAVKITPFVTQQQWVAILEVLNVKSLKTARMARCVEELLKASASAMFSTGDVKAESLALWAKVADRWVRASAALFASRNTAHLMDKDLLAGGYKEEKAPYFLKSHSMRRFGKVLGTFHATVAALVAVQDDTSVATFALWSVLLSQKLVPTDSKGMPSAVIEDALKLPRCVQDVLSENTPANTLSLAAADDFLDDCLLSFGQAATTVQTLTDMCALFSAAPQNTVVTFFSDATKLRKIIAPVTGNPKLFNYANLGPKGGLAASFVKSIGAAHFPAATYDALFKLVAEYLLKAQAGLDKATLLFLLLNFLQAVPPASSATHKPKAPQLQTMLRSLLNSGSSEVATAAWAILGECGAHKALDTLIQPILKSCINNEEQRRAVLLSLPKDFGQTVLSKKLIADAPEVETYQADAILCLKFLNGADLDQKTVQALVTPATVAAIATDEAAVQQLVETSTDLLKAGHPELFALLLSHRNGQVRASMYRYLKSSSSVAVAINLFAAYRSLVFGLDADATWAPNALRAGTTKWGIRYVGTKLLGHLEHLDNAATTITDVLLMCGSDLAVGGIWDREKVDPNFFLLDSQMGGRYRDECGLNRTKWLISYLFQTNSTQQLSMEKNAPAILDRLAAELHEAPHRARAAVRALAALTALATPETAELTSKAMLSATATAIKKFQELSSLDQAIASGSQNEVDKYIQATLMAKGLVKEVQVRPPKGMTQDDWEYQLEKEAKALAAGRVVETDLVAARRAEVTLRVQAMLAPFTAFRIAGTQGAEQSANATAFALPSLFESAAKHETLPPVVNSAVADSICAIMSTTSLGPFAAQLVSLIRRINDVKYCLLSSDISEILNFTARLRTNITHIMHPLLFPALIPITRAVFSSRPSRASKNVPIQGLVQLLTIFVTNCTQQHIPLKADALLLLLTILKSQPTMYKTISSAVHNMVNYTGENDIENVITLSLAGVELVRETATAAMSRFNHYDIYRKAAIVVSAASYDVKPAISSAATSQLEALQFRYDAELDWPIFMDLLKQHRTHHNAITQLAESMNALLLEHPATQDAGLDKVFEIKGLPAVVAIQKTGERLTAQSQVKAAHFLVDVAEDGSSDEYLMEVTLAAGKRLVSVCTEEAIAALSESLIPRLKKSVQGTNKEHKESHNAIAVVWLSAIALRSKNTELLIGSMDQQTTMLNVSDAMLVHTCVCECMSDIARNGLMKGHPKVDDFAQNSLKQVFSAGSYPRKKAHSFGLVGVIYGLGMNSLRRFNVIPQIIAACGDKVVPRSGAMVLIECCADGLGYGFEPYALQLIEYVLNAVGDKDPRVSEVAEDAAKAIMRNLSDIGLRQLVPKLVAGLDVDQTKKKVANLGFLGYIAFCSPKQLAAALPKVVPSITDCICDVNTSVANAAFGALQRVAGVVSNTEIQEHVQTLLKAMRSPGTETENALDGLMYTRFTNVVDPASLALVIPIIERGLSERLHTTKGKSAQIVASMVALVQDTRSLLPYADDLLKKLQDAALDPMNEVRTTASRAISLLVSQLKGKFIDDTVAWCFATLRRAQTSAEKSGAAQCLTDTVAQVGDHLLVQVKDQLLEGTQDADSNVREGFLYVFVFAPSSLPMEMFQAFLPSFFPCVLGALSDASERVRDVALVAGTSIIQLHGARNKDMILGPLMEGVISENTSTRQSSMLLVAKLMIYFAQQIRKRFKVQQNQTDEPEEESPAETGETSVGATQETDVQMDTARDAEKKGFSLIGALEEQLGTEAFCRLLAAIHVGRSEHNSAVRNEVTMAWQVCIASPRTAINKIFLAVVSMLLKFASSPIPECADVTQRCIEYTCSRMNEAIEKFVTLFAGEYQKGGKKRMLGALLCIADVVPYADAARITKMGASIASSVMPALQDEDDEIRAAGGLVFESVGKVVGPRWIESIVETQMLSSVLGVVELVRVRPTATLQVAFDFLAKKKSYSEEDMELMQYLFQIEQAEESLPKHFDHINHVLMQGELLDLTKSAEGLFMFASYLEPAYSVSPLEDYERLMKKPEDRLAALRCILNYCMGLGANSTEAIEKGLSMMIHTLSDSEDAVRDAAAHGFMKLAANLDQKSLEALSDADRADDGSIKRNASKFGAQFADVVAAALGVTARSILTVELPYMPALGVPKMLDTFQLFYNRALEHGGSNQKLVALDGLIELLNFAPTEIAHAAGPTMAAKLVKTLFLRNEGTIVNALLTLCYKIMSFPQSAKDKIVESSMASALFAGCVCDSAEARTKAHRLCILLMKRTPANVDQLLAGVGSKKNLAETNAQRTAMCRYISVIMRHNQLDKRMIAAPGLMTLVRTFWESEGWAELVAAGGMAVGALCATPAIADDVVASIAEKSVGYIKSRSANILAGLACLYALVTRVKSRIDEDIINMGAEALATVFGYTSDRNTVMWALRLTGALCRFPVAVRHFKADAVAGLLKRVGRADDQMHSTGHYVVELLKPAMKQAHGTPHSFWEEFWAVPSGLSTEMGFFDADLDDEYHSGTPVTA